MPKRLLDQVRDKLRLKHYSIRKLMTTCHSQFFNLTKLFSSLQTLYESFLAFHFCTIIVSFNFALSASHIIYGHFCEKAERFGATKNIQHIPLFVLSSGSYYSSARTDQWLSSLCGDSGQRKGGNVKSVSVRRQEIATIIILREKTS